MNSDYLAWNGERYVWPPPEGWYLASDGRWWAPDTGPEMEGWANLDLPAESISSDTPDPTIPLADPGENLSEPTVAASGTGTAEPVNTGPSVRVAQDLDNPAPTSHFSTGAAESADLASTGASSSAPLDPHTISLDVDGARPAPDHDPSTAETPSILAEAETEAPPTQISGLKSLPMAATGLLVAAALAIAGLLAFVGGDDDDEAPQPSASLQPSDESAEMVATPSSDSAMDDGAMDDGAMDDGAMDDSAMDDSAMDDSAMDDSAMDDGAMADEESADTSSPAAGDGAGGEDAVKIGQFRTLLEDNQITAAELTGDDLAVFGVTACSYAQSSGDLADYEEIRAGVLDGAVNEELTVDELQFIIDSAVTIFCPEDAERLGITAGAE